MSRSIVLALSLAATVLCSTARAASPQEVFGEAWTAASPAERLALLSTALTDKSMVHAEVQTAVEETVRAAIAPGETPEARLTLFGRLRAEAQELLKAKNEERKKAGGKPASFTEPANDTQEAVALDHLATAAGPAPSLEALGCLALVREATSWTAHHSVILSALAEAINRDEPYRAANLEGKLTIIRDLAVDRKMMSDQERKYLEEPLVLEHLSARLRAGDAPAAIADTVKKWREKGLVCFFTQSFADGMLKRLGEHRAARGQ